MADSNWDGGAMPPRKEGVPLWGKIGIGCGVAVFLLALTCGGVVYWGMSKGTQAIDKAWAEMRTQVTRLQTEEGAKALYRENPGLAKNYPTEEEFLKASEAWRSRLSEVPLKRPDLKTLFDPKAGGGFHFDSHQVSDGPKDVTVSYRLPSGARILIKTEDDRLTDIRVE
jgi:hypothetical protein